ncbi:hypothetical protein F4859DRAFT_164577 [Xylaria cf. heliscus]|nr:hypothetical protein F4859DRAFT_164577 [Xylaria cf. heliscus]
MDVDSDDDYRESSSENEITRPPIYNAHGVSPIRGSIPIRRKRRAESSATPAGLPPLKRMKGDFNAAYLDLLNRDINDASSGLIHGEAEEATDEQIGAVVWSAAEKDAFFAAVSRLGKANFARISARIGTKSELEVRQYLVLLDATEGEGKGKGKKGARQNLLRPVDIPAAVEIGAECGAALEAAADALSLRQGSYEEQIEKERWGSIWRVTAPLAESFESRQQRNSEALTSQPKTRERGPEEQQRDEKEDTGDQLQLEDDEQEKKAAWDSNWRAVSEEHETPAIRMTALADFYGLAYSVTRRLLIAAMYVAESRVRRNSFEVVQRRKKAVIRVEDVIAAVSSLGMKQNSKEFWARCARRLRLNVVDDETGEDSVTDQEYEESGIHSEEEIDRDDQLMNTVESESGSTEASGQDTEENEDEDGQIMSYDEVEDAFGYPVVDNMHSRPSTSESGAPTTTDISSGLGDEADEEEQYQGEEDDEHEGDVKMEDQPETPDVGLDSDAIAKDVEEAMISLASNEHAIVGADATRATKSRIRAEHRLERDAELHDGQASVEAEAQLWAVLRGDSGTRTSDHRRRG